MNSNRWNWGQAVVIWGLIILLIGSALIVIIADEQEHSILKKACGDSPPTTWTRDPEHDNRIDSVACEDGNSYYFPYNNQSQ
jgi:hypothetical protein